MITTTRIDDYPSPFLPEEGRDFRDFIEADLPPKSPEGVQELTRSAFALAESISTFSPENIDPKRVEFGNTVVALTEVTDQRALNHAEGLLSNSLSAVNERILTYRKLEQQDVRQQDLDLAA